MRIVINADDFGYSADTVAATISSIDRGLITSASIMPRAAESEAALAFARTCDRVSFGVHLTFVGEGGERSVSPPERIPSLAHGDGSFRRSRLTRVRALTRLLPPDQVTDELTAQIRLVADAGVSISHVDSHRHLHKLPAFHEPLRRVLPAQGIFRVRSVQDVYINRPRFNLTSWIGGSWRRELQREFISTDHFYMPSTAGDEAWHRIVPKLQTLAGDTIEVGLHPGTAEEWRRRELESLPRFVEEVVTAGHELVSWREVGRERSR
jgi:predicted glycoside hydrolase/deacetylase ChbG (UPF0249 family)